MKKTLYLGLTSIFLISILLYWQGYGLFVNHFYLPQVGNHTELVIGGGGSDYLSSLSKSVQKRNVTWIIKPRKIYLTFEEQEQIAKGAVVDQNQQAILDADVAKTLATTMETGKLTNKNSNLLANITPPLQLNFERLDGLTVRYYLYQTDNQTYIEDPNNRLYAIHRSFYQSVVSWLGN